METMHSDDKYQKWLLEILSVMHRNKMDSVSPEDTGLRFPRVEQIHGSGRCEGRVVGL